MPRIVWSPRATQDIQRLYRFLASRNPEAAKRAVLAIRSDVRTLMNQPRSGRRIDGMAPEFWEWIVDFGRDGYLVRNGLSADEVVILAIRHGREDGYQQPKFSYWTVRPTRLNSDHLPFSQRY
ncbi:MAG: type II toxin-antitoxin system RelE/ParE family toxin [Rhizobiaceae bacterium]|nr:type II toxin-antitoxin system RelE/ParE family toxin [Rhizobiaceae bacterium]